MVKTHDRTESHERPRWRGVAIPSEHGGWGLTLEPIVLGLLVAFSWPGMAIGAAAMLAFLVRTPLKLALVDRRRHRSLPRTRLAGKVAVGELLGVAALAVAAIATVGFAWLVPVLVALPLFAIELAYDVRSRGRRLVPELCGGVGMASVAAAIIVAGNGASALAAASALVVAARATASIPFVRTQVARLRHGSASLRRSDVFQAAGAAVAVGAALVDGRVVLGTIAIVALAGAQVRWARRPVPPVKTIGMVQMMAGLGISIATAVGAVVW